MITLPWKKNCLECFYCSKAWRSPDHGKENIMTLKPDERQKARHGVFDYLRQSDTVSQYNRCYRGNWDEAVDGSDIQAIRSNLNKKKCPKFLSYKKAEGMLFPAAVEDQNQRENNYKQRVMFWLTVVGVTASIIAAIASVMGVVK